MLPRQTTGSTVCPGCGKLVGVADERCFNCGRPRPGMFGYAPLLRRLGNDLGFVHVVLGGCIVLYAATLLADPSGIRMDGLFGLLGPSGKSLFLFGASGAVPMLQLERWWTPLSAGWLHGGLLHIAFNLYWVRLLAPPVAEHYGPGRMVVLYTLSSVVGFLVSTYAFFAPGFLQTVMGGGAGITVGASAALFGLLGALVYYGRRGSSEVGRQAWGYALLLFVFGLFMGSVDNWAHLGGFLGGYLGGKLLDPAKPERLDHLLAALLCLVATVAAVVASVVTGWGLLQ